MAKRHLISAEQKAELEAARKTNKNKSVDRRLKALIMRANGRKYAEIGKECEFHPTYVGFMVSAYCEKGLDAAVGNHYQGNRRNLSLGEEAELLSKYKKDAEAGRVVEVGEIKRAYEEKAGHPIGSGQIYRVLERHGWRMVMPRGKHPDKAGDEAVEASKKLKPSTGGRWNYIPNMG